MRHIKLFESFEQSQIDEFIDIIKNKILDLTDIGFKVRVDPFAYGDKNSEPLLENMIRVIIDKSDSMYTNFQFKKCSYVVSDILLTNMDMNLYKKVHVIIQPDWRENHQSERLSWVFVQGEQEAKWSYENKSLKGFDPLNLPITRIEIYFE
jgi:phage pi2 protein 07